MVLSCRDERFDLETDQLHRSVLFSVYTCLVRSRLQPKTCAQRILSLETSTAPPRPQGVFVSSWLVIPFIGLAFRENDEEATPPLVYSGLEKFEFTYYGGIINCERFVRYVLVCFHG